jgi:hypothetical protein
LTCIWTNFLLHLDALSFLHHQTQTTKQGKRIMPTSLAVQGKTSPEKKAPIDLKCDCQAIWTLAQQYAICQIVTHAPVCQGKPDYREGNPAASSTMQNKTPPEFVSNYAVRARRIAAAYAATYLEDFSHGKKELVGRFYWLGLGAFASKQVAVTLESKLLRTTHLYPTYQLLGRGNQWLFNDVLAWFYGYACGADTFMLCAKRRHSDNFMEPTKTSFRRQVDYEKAIQSVPQQRDGKTGEVINDQLGYLQWTSLVQTGFNSVKDWENAAPALRPKHAMKHLLAIAQHEQGEVLQGLIYDKLLFRAGLNLQSAALAPRPTDNVIVAAIQGPIGMAEFDASVIAHALIPNLELVLTADDTTDDENFKSLPKRDIKLQDYKQRIGWINDAANKYDNLMTGYKSEMHAHLARIASWGDLPDNP